MFSACILLAVAASSSAQYAKYVFLFIGDGMSSPQIHATEAYLAQSAQPDNPEGLSASIVDEDGDGEEEEIPASLGTAGVAKLTMSQLPVVGLQMTYADNRFITGSAASATALACGKKSSIGTIAMDPTQTTNYTTIAELAKQKGMKVGIVSSVSIDHATPACFYAHQKYRGYYWEIANELSDSGFDYFAGGGMKGEKIKSGSRSYAPDKPKADASNDPIQHAVDNGYKIVTNKTDLMNLTSANLPVFAYSKDYVDNDWALPYELDRTADDASLADYTTVSIRLLDNPNGFFMMVEGGKIDWACHANDAKTAIVDTIAFDDAVAVALDFYAQHPDETLIVVTGDHECGGLTLGFAGLGYETAYEILDGQTMSYLAFNDYIAKYRENPYSFWNFMRLVLELFGPADADLTALNIADDMEMQSMIQQAFGLVYDKLNEYEVGLLEDAYDKTMSGAEEREDPGENKNYSADGINADLLTYGPYYDPLTVTCTHILNRRAGLGFTSYYHTALPVPVFAQGNGASAFTGEYDNTDVALKIANAMGVDLNN
jgi:alkaline phosphatase